MSQEAKQKMVRFDFPPGATPEQIADALKTAYAEVMARKNAALTRVDGRATTSSDATNCTT
jgi:hypothetical protein